jgi:hypothetical protein
VLSLSKTRRRRDAQSTRAGSDPERRSFSQSIRRGMPVASPTGAIAGEPSLGSRATDT